MKNDMDFYMDLGEKGRDLAGVFLHRVGMNIHKLNCILNFLKPQNHIYRLLKNGMPLAL